ncbi:MAG TPA: pilus assembly protein TadG-related protein [Candidatus Nitrosotalea sp.]|nr:pilus assembly protein TadG-related protein [Candidatus Nitrosotalea sp.]
MSGRARASERGSILVLVAMMSLILIAFVGLAVDGGEIQAQQRQSQNAADGAALAAGTAILNSPDYGYSTTDATNIADTVAGFSGIVPADVTIAYYDSTSSPTTVPASVVTVTASVTHTFATLFLPVMNIDTATVQAQATVTLSQSPAGCAICVMSPGASPALESSNGAQVTATGGPIQVLSNASPAITTSNSGVITAPSITSVGTVSGPTTPTALTGSSYTFPDPLAAIPVPTLGQPAANVTYGSSTTINPGTYGTITIPLGVTVTMNPGLYVIAGGLSLNGVLRGNGVNIYFACVDGSGNASTCSSPTDPGNINVAGSMVISAPPTGSTYSGLAIFGDRNNTATFTVGGTLTPTGTVYAPSMNMFIPDGSHQSLTSRVVLGSIDVDSGGRLFVNYSQSGNYVTPGKIELTS